MRYLFPILLLLVPLVSCGQTGPGSCPTNTLVGNAGGGLTCLNGTQAGGIVVVPSTVTSVNNYDGTLTVSPAQGGVIASIALGHPNGWPSTQTFSNVVVSSITSAGTQCVQAGPSGILSGTGTGCGSSGTSGSAVTNVSNTDGSLTISPTTGAVVASVNIVSNSHLAVMPADTVKCNPGGSPAGPSDCISPKTFTYTFIASAAAGINDQSAVSSNLGTYWTSSGPAIVHRMNRLLVGPAASDGTGCPSSPNSWMNSIVGGTCDLSNIVVDSTLFAGIQSGGRTSVTCASGIGCPSGGSAGAYLFGYNDNNTSGNIAVGSNSVAFADAGTKGIVVGAQQDVNNKAVTCVPTPQTPNCTAGTPVAIGTLITPGAFSFATQNPTEALLIGTGHGPTFNAGIVITDGSLAAGVGPQSSTVGIALPAGVSIIWYNAGSGVAAINADSAGNVNVVTTGGGCLKVNGTCVNVP